MLSGAGAVLPPRRHVQPVHIRAAIVRGEEPPRKAAWFLLDGASVPFRYGHEVLTNGKHFWLRVECPILYVVREKLGLDSPMLDFHLTVAVLGADQPG